MATGRPKVVVPANQVEDVLAMLYRAEVVLEGEAARQLPAGLPLQAERIDERH